MATCDPSRYVIHLFSIVFCVKLTTDAAFPHCTNVDDIYNGQYIPAGTIIMGNAWYAEFFLVLFPCLFFTDNDGYRSMFHDPVFYPNPTEFKPERYLKEDGTLNPDPKDPCTFAFGFGRRICPGRFLSDSSLYRVITSILSVCDVFPISAGPAIDVCPKHRERLGVGEPRWTSRKSV
jgi:hypothetical protein